MLGREGDQSLHSLQARPGSCTHPHSFLSGKKTDKAAARAALQLIVGQADRVKFAHNTNIHVMNLLLFETQNFHFKRF